MNFQVQDMSIILSIKQKTNQNYFFFKTCNPPRQRKGEKRILPRACARKCTWEKTNSSFSLAKIVHDVRESAIFANNWSVNNFVN